MRPSGGHAVVLKWSMWNIYGLRPKEVWWSASDLGWVVGHSYICYGPLLNGNTTIVYEVRGTAGRWGYALIPSSSCKPNIIPMYGIIHVPLIMNCKLRTNPWCLIFVNKYCTGIKFVKCYLHMAKHENGYDTGTCNNFKKHKFVKFEYQKYFVQL